MKRPLAVTGLTGLCAQCLLLMVKPVFSLLFSMMLLLAGVLLAARQRSREHAVVWVMVLTAGVVGLSTASQLLRQEPIRKLDGITARVQGQITDLTLSDDQAILTVEVREMIHQRTGETVAEHVRVMLYTSELVEAEIYDEVDIRLVQLTAPADGFGWSDRSRCAAKGVVLTGYFLDTNCTATPGKVPWYGLFQRLRAQLRYALYELLPREQAALVTAMTLGDRSGLDDGATRQFQRSGLGAVLVVSGLHLTLLLGTVQLLLRVLLRSYRIAAGITLPLVWGFVGLTGCGSSSIRAGVTMTLWLLAILLQRGVDPLNSLGAAALVLLCVRPCAGGDVGVQLSFLAVAGILTLGKWIREAVLDRLPKKWRRSRWILGAVSGLAASVGATAGTLPMSLLVFGYLPLLSIPANLLAMLPVEAVLVCGMSAACAGALGWDALAKPCGWVAGQAARVLQAATGWLSSRGVLQDVCGILTGWMFLCMIILGVLLLIPVKRRYILRAAALCLVPLVVWSCAGYGIPPRPGVTVLSGGSGTVVRICTGTETVTVLLGDVRQPEYFDAYPAGHVVLLQDEYDEQAVQMLHRLPETQIESVHLPWTVLPDVWCMEPPPYPVNLNAGDSITPAEGILVRRYLLTDGTGVCRVSVGEYDIVIPLPGTDLSQVDIGLCRGELGVLAFGDLTHTYRVVTDRVILGGSAADVRSLILDMGVYREETYEIHRTGGVELWQDAAGNFRATVP